MISVTVKGVEQLQAKFKALGKEGKENLQKACDETALDGVRVAMQSCPVVTARLRSSIHIESQKRRGYKYSNKGKAYDGSLGYTITGIGTLFGTNVEYAASVNHGHRQYDIYPRKRGGVLAWKMPVGMNMKQQFLYRNKKGKLVTAKKNAAYNFAKKVTIPAKAGNHFFERGIEEAERSLLPNMKKYLNLNG
jgi:hypothetical protein